MLIALFCKDRANKIIGYSICFNRPYIKLNIHYQNTKRMPFTILLFS